MGLLDNDIFDDNVEEDKTLAVKRNTGDTVETLVLGFRQYLDDWEDHLYDPDTSKIDDGRFKQYVEDLMEDMYVTSDDVERFFKDIEMLKNHEQYQTKSNHFVSHIFQRAYECGHNEFQIRQRSKSPDHVCSNIITPGDLTLKVEFFSQTGTNCAVNLNRSYVEFHEDSGEFSGLGMKNSTLVFRKSAGDSSALLVQNTLVYFHGDMGEGCGQGSKNSNFYSQDEDALKKMAELTFEGCNFYLIDGNGKSRKKVKGFGYPYEDKQ